MRITKAMAQSVGMLVDGIAYDFDPELLACLTECLQTWHGIPKPTNREILVYARDIDGVVFTKIFDTYYTVSGS